MENIKVVYEISWLINKVYRESDKLIGKITDTSKFEDRCIKDLARYLNLDKSHRKNKRQLIRIINRNAGEFISTYRTEKSISFSVISNYDEEDEDKQLEFDEVDVLANVESDVIAKEMTALLAQDDHRKKVILGNWILGNDNNSDISRLLAQTFGGNEEAHRKFIQRFRKDCRESLSA